MKRVLAAALAALLFLTACGCTALFDKDVYLEEAYEATSESVETGDSAEAISNYAALRRAILRLVSERAESAELQFQNYDGTISRDISTACWEVKSSTALGAFAVDYISYDLSRIVSYYQAEIHITYKRSEYQMSALETVETLSAMRDRLAQALGAGETYLVLSLTAASLTGDTVRSGVERAYYDDPLVCPVLPTAEASLYPESGMSRIVEVTLDYGLDSASLAARREELGAALEALMAAVAEAAPIDYDDEQPVPDAPEEESSPEPADESARTAALLKALCAEIAENCAWDETAGATAWDALTQGAAGSEGMAMALKAGCKALGVDCDIVFGRLNGENHMWNVVTVDGGAYHVDVSRWAEGEDAVFLVGDEELWGLYWWDTSEVPACPVRYGEQAEPSGEPASAEAETEADLEN